MQKFIELDMKKKLDPKAVTFGVWSLVDENLSLLQQLIKP